MMRAGRWMSALAVSAAMVSTLGACRKPATGLRVMVTTDFVPSASMPQLHSVMLRVTSLPSGTVLHEEMVNVLNGSASLPLKFGVFLTGAPNERVRIEAEAHTVETQANPRDAMGNSTALTASRVVTGFVDGQIRVVPMVLYRGCWDSRVRCEPDSTCGPTAMCESAQRDPNGLPTYDRDAGDPTDVFNIPMDASVPAEAGADGGGMDVLPPIDGMGPPLDGMLPPIDGMGPPPDGMVMPSCTAPFVAPTPVEFAMIGAGTQADPRRFDLLSRTQMVNVGGIPSNPVELVWAPPYVMGTPQHVFSAQVTSASVTRMTAVAGTALGPGPIDVLSAYTTNVGGGGMMLAERFGVFAASHMMAIEPSMMVSGGVVDTMTGLAAATNYPSPNGTFSAMESHDWNGAAMMANPVPDSAMPTTMTACVPTELSSTLFCYRSSGAAGSFAFRVTLPVAAGNHPRIASMVDSMGAIQWLIEPSNGQSVLMCSAMPPMMPGSTVGASCETVSLPAGTRMAAGSLSGQWLQGPFNCPGSLNYMGGWYGALEELTGMTSTLRAGRFTGATTATNLWTAQSVMTAGSVRTALGIAPGACEMLVTRLADGQLELRRAKIASSMVSAPTNVVRFSAQSNVRSTALAPRGARSDEHFVAVVDDVNAIRLFRIEAPCM